MQIRQANESDIPTFHRVFDRIWPNHLGLAELHRDLELMPEKQRMTLWLIEANGEVIGVSRLYRLLGAYHPQKWYFEMGILEEQRRNGYGSFLYNHAINLLKQLDAIQLTGRCRDDDPWSLKFMTDRGFVETKRDFESTLSLKNLDLKILDEMDHSIFDIRSAKEADSDEFRQQWHRLFEEVRKDIPRDDPPTPLTFEEFAEIFLADQEFLWDVSMFAFDNDEMVGCTFIYEMDGRGVLFQALTAVRNTHRGQGLAKALKARAMRRAIEKGFAEVHADNDERNKAMISINKRLGYQAKPGMVSLRKDLTLV